jgi:hypothetical protein
MSVTMSIKCSRTFLIFGTDALNSGPGCNSVILSNPLSFEAKFTCKLQNVHKRCESLIVCVSCLHLKENGSNI